MRKLDTFDVDAPDAPWRDPANYGFVKALPPASCAWEFLRRNPDYQKEWSALRSHVDGGQEEVGCAAAWGLLRFESPYRDARSANVFWHPSSNPEILPVIATAGEHSDEQPRLSLDELGCRVVVQTGRAGDQHILFAEDGRSLQLEVHGVADIETALLTTEIVRSPGLFAARAQALKRFADIVEHRSLRARLYPPDNRAARFSRVLQILDASHARACYRDMAFAVYGEARVSTGWGTPYLRDHLRRALRSGRALMMNGYRRLVHKSQRAHHVGHR